MIPEKRGSSLIIDGASLKWCFSNLFLEFFFIIIYFNVFYAKIPCSQSQNGENWTLTLWVGQPIRGAADKSLARPTSRCRRTESMVSLERGFCSCAELQVFLVTEAERKHVRRRARFQQHRDASCHQVFFLQGKAPKEIHAILTERIIRGTCTIVCHPQKLDGPV